MAEVDSAYRQAFTAYEALYQDYPETQSGMSYEKEFFMK